MDNTCSDLINKLSNVFILKYQCIKILISNVFGLLKRIFLKNEKLLMCQRLVLLIRPIKLRPISLLPVVSKIFEKIVVGRYHRSFLQSFDSSQFAYRPKSSTVCALITIQDTVVRLLDDISISAVRL